MGLVYKQTGPWQKPNFNVIGEEGIKMFDMFSLSRLHDLDYHDVNCQKKGVSFFT